MQALDHDAEDPRPGGDPGLARRDEAGVVDAVANDTFGKAFEVLNADFAVRTQRTALLWTAEPGANSEAPVDIASNSM